MNKNLILLLIVVAIAGVFFLQNDVYGIHFYLGGKTGMSVNNLDFSSDNTDVRNNVNKVFGSRTSAKYSAYNILGSAMLIPWDTLPLAFQGDVGVTTKGVALGGDVPEQFMRTHLDEKWSLTYTTISLIPKAYIEIGKLKKLSFDFGVGVFYSQLLKSNRAKNNKVGNYISGSLVNDYVDDEETNLKSWIKNSDYGVVISLGTHYEIIQNLRFGFEFRYDLGLADIAKDAFKYETPKNEYGNESRPFYDGTSSDSAAKIRTSSFMVLLTMDYRIDSIFKGKSKSKKINPN